MSVAVIALLGGVRGTVFAAVAAVAIIATGVQSWRLDSAQDARDQAQEDRDEWRHIADSALSANETNQKTIADLQEANRRWAALSEFRKQLADVALAAVSSERDALEHELVRRRANRGMLYEKEPEAAVWGRTAVPPAIADGLRR